VPEYHGESLNQENEAPLLGSISYVCMGPDITLSNLCCCWDHTAKAQHSIPGGKTVAKAQIDDSAIIGSVSDVYNQNPIALAL
jgi:hypothetical protein